MPIFHSNLTYPRHEGCCVESFVLLYRLVSIRTDPVMTVCKFWLQGRCKFGGSSAPHNSLQSITMRQVNS